MQVPWCKWIAAAAVSSVTMLELSYHLSHHVTPHHQPPAAGKAGFKGAQLLSVCLCVSSKNSRSWRRGGRCLLQPWVTTTLRFGALWSSPIFSDDDATAVFLGGAARKVLLTLAFAF